MKFLSKRTNRQVGGFFLVTIAWILCSTSVGHPQWRVWYIKGSNVSKPKMVFVGMWKTCIYPSANNSSNVVCHQYTYHDTFIPMDIRISQHLMLVSSFLSLIGTVTTTVRLWNWHTRKEQKKVTSNPFFVIGILNIVSTSFVFLAVLFNYLSIKLQVGIAFPPSFNVPSVPYSQKIGSAMVAASFAAFLFLLSGIIFTSLNFPLETLI